MESWKSRIRAAVIAFCVFVAVFSASLMASVATAQNATSVDDYAQAIQTLFDNMSDLRTQREQLSMERAQLPEGSDTSLVDADIAELDAEIGGLQQSLADVTLGSAAADFQPKEAPTSFNVEQELYPLLSPLIRMAQEVTADQRRIQEFTDEVEALAQREQIALNVVDRLRPLLFGEREFTPEAKAYLEEQRNRWSNRVEETRNLRDATQSELANLIAEREAGQRSLGEIIGEQVVQRGINLALAAVAAAVVVGSTTLLRLLIVNVYRRYAASPVLPFTIRLLSLILSAVGLVGALGAAMYIFERREDLILLALTLLLVIGLGWLLVRSAAGMMGQLRLLLNLGSVQEGERIIWDDVPYLVADLNFYSTLRNPELDGGTLELPINMLEGHLSRPVADGEPWFPTKPGDWVREGGETLLQVIKQTPEAVYMRGLGREERMMPTADFLGAGMENLARGVRIESAFGVHYKHQGLDLFDVASQMQSAVAKALEELVGKALAEQTRVEPMRAADSAIEFEIEVDLDGPTIAENPEVIEAVQFRMQSSLLALCHQQGWEVPFPQIELSGRLAR